MIADLLKDHEFQKLEKEYSFLRRARETLYELENSAYVIVDIETTGLEPTKSEIIEIGALKVENNEIKDVFSTLICPMYDIPTEITRLTGITQDEVAGYPKASTVLNKFLNFIGDATLVAHNTDFDISFLKHHIKQNLNVDLNNSVFCTLKISRLLLPNLANHKLHTIAEYFDVPISNRHRAMGDAEITYQIWFNFIKLLRDRNIVRIKELYEFCSRDTRKNQSFR